MPPFINYSLLNLRVIFEWEQGGIPLNPLIFKERVKLNYEKIMSKT